MHCGTSLRVWVNFGNRDEEERKVREEERKKREEEEKKCKEEEDKKKKAKKDEYVMCFNVAV